MEVSWNLTKMNKSIILFLGRELYWSRKYMGFTIYRGVILVRWVQMQKPIALRNIHCSPQFSRDLNAKDDSGPLITQNSVVWNNLIIIILMFGWNNFSLSFFKSKSYLISAWKTTADLTDRKRNISNKQSSTDQPAYIYVIL